RHEWKGIGASLAGRGSGLDAGSPLRGGGFRAGNRRPLRIGHSTGKGAPGLLAPECRGRPHGAGGQSEQGHYAEPLRGNNRFRGPESMFCILYTAKPEEREEVRENFF